MGQLAHIIAAKGGIYVQTGFRSYQVGTHEADSLSTGLLDANAGELDGLTGQQLAEAMVARYGPGAGFPWQLDPAAAPAQSVLPTEDARNRGWKNEHSMPDPSPAALSRIGWVGTFADFTKTDTMDLSACYHFQEYLASLDNTIQPTNPQKPHGNDSVSTLPVPPVDSPELIHLRGAKSTTLAIITMTESTLPPTGKGGVYVRTMRAAFDGIKKALGPIAILVFLLSSLSACSSLRNLNTTNKVIAAAAVGQAGGAAAVLQCSRMVESNPMMTPVILDKIANARLILNQGNPLLSLFALDKNTVDPQTALALSILNSVLADANRATTALVLGVLNGCETGARLAAPPIAGPTVVLVK